MHLGLPVAIACSDAVKGPDIIMVATKYATWRLRQCRSAALQEHWFSPCIYADARAIYVFKSAALM